jgi:regulatory protein
MKIERVVKKDDENVVIWLDNQEKLFLSYEVFLKNRLKKDMEISEDGFSFLIKENQKYFIKKKAFQFLGRRLHSYNELKIKLLRKKYDIALVTEVLDYLKEKSFLDDNEFAKMYTEEKVRTKLWGLNKIKSELFRKGIQAEIIEKILAEVDLLPVENAMSAGEKKLNILMKRNYTARELSSKLYTYLYSKGYDYDTIKEVTDRLVKSEDIT